MALEITSRSAITLQEWDALVNTSHDGWVFSLYGWQELILNVKDWGLEDFSFGVYENTKLIGVVPLQFNPNSRVMSSSGWGGSGPVLNYELSEKSRKRVLIEIFNECLTISKNKGAQLLDVSMSPVTKTAIKSKWGVNPFVLLGFEDKSQLSQVINLEVKEDKLWLGLSADARRQINIAKEKGFIVEKVNWKDEIDNYYKLHEETYDRTGVKPHPKSYFEGIANITGCTGNSILWVAKSKEGKNVAYHNAAWLGEGGYYHTGCSVTNINKLGVSYLLFWEALLGAKKAGLLWYDVGTVFPRSADQKQQGLSTFKTKFGGELHRLFRTEVNVENQVCDSEKVPLESYEYKLSCKRYFLYSILGEKRAKSLINKIKLLIKRYSIF